MSSPPVTAISAMTTTCPSVGRRPSSAVLACSACDGVGATVASLTARSLRAARWGSTERKVTSDDFFNVVVTCYHRIDWIKNDPSVPRDAKEDVNSVYSNTYVGISRNLSNASKCFSLDSKYKHRVVHDRQSAMVSASGASALQGSAPARSQS